MSASKSADSLEATLVRISGLLQTDPAMAGKQAAEILKIVGNHPMALLLLGASHTARGDARKAIEILSPLAQAQPKWAMAQLEFGIALGRAGLSEEALAALRRAVALQPDLPRGWLALADRLFAVGDLADADAAYVSHVKFSDRDPVLLAAAATLSENRVRETEALLRGHLEQMPTDVAAMHMLADVMARLGRDDDAERLLARCLELAPSFHAARRRRVLILNGSNKHSQALVEIESLLTMEPENPDYRNLKAAILCRIGDFEPAIELYAGILDEYPGHAKIWMNYGYALKAAGYADRTIDAYRKGIDLDPGLGVAWWNLANLKTVRFSAEDLHVMRRQLRRPDLGAEHRHYLEFAVGKALEDAGDYAGSFEHYMQGNAIRRNMVSYSADETSMRTKHLKYAHSREFFRQRAGFGAKSRDPVFIVGMPRSGSTLIEQILSSHSTVEGTMELPDILSITRILQKRSTPPQNGSYQDELARLDAGELREFGEMYLKQTRVHRKTDAPVFIDKMPNNFAHVGLIHLILPNAKIIDARRHPLACCFSCIKQDFASGQNFSYSLHDVGRYYHDYVELMAHYDEVLPGRMHRVIYEDLIDDTEAEVRRLLDYCELPFEAQCLRFFENERPVQSASSEQVRRPIYRDGIDHWRHFDQWLGPLKITLGPVLDAYPATPGFRVDNIDKS